MNKLHIITPVKDSIETTLRTIDSIISSETSTEFSYIIYNDFSTDDATEKLRDASLRQNFTLVNLKDLTTHPSPNYLMVLQLAQKQAIEDGAHLMIVESDVIINKDTIQRMYDDIDLLDNAGIIAAVTTDVNGEINFPYLYAKKFNSSVIDTRKRLSFCCTLLTNNFLNKYSFENLNPEKMWFDIFISHKSVELGFKNYLLTSLPVLHLPHSSRPWKLLKYSNPLKYYWRKITKGLDKI